MPLATCGHGSGPGDDRLFYGDLPAWAPPPRRATSPPSLQPSRQSQRPPSRGQPSRSPLAGQAGGRRRPDQRLPRASASTCWPTPTGPTYHFVIPEGFAFPFDPNGAIYWKGRYHLCYIYQDHGVHVFGHVSSLDMLHWRHHLPALYPTPDSPEKGIFSGNCFVNRKGEATMVYHGVRAGNCMATSSR